MTLTTLYIITYVLDAFAIGLSIYSGVIQHRANKQLSQAIKELHESHDELHELLKRI